MATTDGQAEADAGVGTTADEPAISAYSTSEERVVFTESKNSDGWIATDLTVEPQR